MTVNTQKLREAAEAFKQACEEGLFETEFGTWQALSHEFDQQVSHTVVIALLDEIDALRERLEINSEAPEWDGIACRDETIRCLEQEIDALADQAQAANADALDAARYRWLRRNVGAERTNGGKGPVSVYLLWRPPASDSVAAETDAAIDAAMRKEGVMPDYSIHKAVQARQWQPIETAPHETLVVLGWHDENGVFKQEIALASAGTRYPGGASDMWWHGSATHWMPLPPDPPQGETT